VLKRLSCRAPRRLAHARLLGSSWCAHTASQLKRSEVTGHDLSEGEAQATARGRRGAHSSARLVWGVSDVSSRPDAPVPVATIRRSPELLVPWTSGGHRSSVVGDRDSRAGRCGHAEQAHLHPGRALLRQPLHITTVYH
jgi:hypothetical protein